MVCSLIKLNTVDIINKQATNYDNYIILVAIVKVSIESNSGKCCGKVGRTLKTQNSRATMRICECQEILSVLKIHWIVIYTYKLPLSCAVSPSFCLQLLLRRRCRRLLEFFVILFSFRRFKRFGTTTKTIIIIMLMLIKFLRMRSVVCYLNILFHQNEDRKHSAAATTTTRAMTRTILVGNLHG